MTLFFIGALEMVLVTIWTKLVTETKAWSSGVITFIQIIVWYYVISTIVDNIDNWMLAVFYALGCAAGTVACTYYYHFKAAKKRRKKKVKNNFSKVWQMIGLR